jgi:hypothetical protein
VSRPLSSTSTQAKTRAGVRAVLGAS